MTYNIYNKLTTLFRNNNHDKLRVLYELCDILESYEYKDYNIENLNEILNFLVSKIHTENDSKLKDQISEAINLVFMYQQVNEFNFDSIILVLDNLSEFALSNLLEVLGQSNNASYLNLLEQYKNHSNILVREAAYNAISNLCSTI
ncbi:hypothetical protein ACQCVE_13010 [Metabacillus sp. 113a]|uniref:hypothetical protein n=1 Tax=Metabacillus sp. 113a TaxID=3404706 RepID=UPI003CE86376